MPTLLDLERELQRAYEVIERQSKTIEMLAALVTEQLTDEAEGDEPLQLGYMNSRG